MTVEKLHPQATEAYTYPGYERVCATVDFAVNPSHPANQRIVDLCRAPRGDDGLVRFDADLRILKPADGGSGNLLFVVPNRGLLAGVPFSMGGGFELSDPENLDPGDGFLLERGWTIAWCGWQWDVPRRPGSLGLTAPEPTCRPAGCGWNGGPTPRATTIR